jgi:hypothetical protein
VSGNALSNTMCYSTCDSEQGAVAGFCEHGEERLGSESDSIKCGKPPD